MAREILQDDENYRVEHLDWRGKDALYKGIKDTLSDERRKAFQNEIVGMQTFRTLAVKHPEWQLVVPEVFEEGDDYVVRDFIEGEELLSPETTREEAKARLARLAEVLAGIDLVQPDQGYTPGRDSAPYIDIRRRFEAWGKAPLESGMLVADDFAAANSLIEEYQAHLQPRYAHGDMSPFKHAYLLPGESLGFIDFEHFSPQKPRYYDAAYAYSRIFTRSSNPGIAGDFLQHFLEISEPAPRKTEQLLAIMTQRAIGMHFDAYTDAQKGEDYAARAQLLLRLCLSRNVALLTDINGEVNA